MTSEAMVRDQFGLTAAELRACQILAISPAEIARERRARLLADTDYQQEAPACPTTRPSSARTKPKSAG